MSYLKKLLGLAVFGALAATPLAGLAEELGFQINAVGGDYPFAVVRVQNAHLERDASFAGINTGFRLFQDTFNFELLSPCQHDEDFDLWIVPLPPFYPPRANGISTQPVDPKILIHVSVGTGDSAKVKFTTISSYSPPGEPQFCATYTCPTRGSYDNPTIQLRSGADCGE